MKTPEIRTPVGQNFIKTTITQVRRGERFGSLGQSNTVQCTVEHMDNAVEHELSFALDAKCLAILFEFPLISRLPLTSISRGVSTSGLAPAARKSTQGDGGRCTPALPAVGAQAKPAIANKNGGQHVRQHDQRCKPNQIMIGPTGFSTKCPPSTACPAQRADGVAITLPPVRGDRHENNLPRRP
jgi:hypothetical protein